MLRFGWTRSTGDRALLDPWKPRFSGTRGLGQRNTTDTTDRRICSEQIFFFSSFFYSSFFSSSSFSFFRRAFARITVCQGAFKLPRSAIVLSFFRPVAKTQRSRMEAHGVQWQHGAPVIGSEGSEKGPHVMMSFPDLSRRWIVKRHGFCEAEAAPCP